MGAFQRTREKLKMLKARIGLSPGNASSIKSNTHEASKAIPREAFSRPTKTSQRRFGLELQRGISIPSNVESTYGVNTSPRLHGRAASSTIINVKHNRTSTILHPNLEPRNSPTRTSSSKRLSGKKPVMDKQAALLLGLPANVYVTPTDAAAILIQPKCH